MGMLVAYTAALVTWWKIVLYWPNEAFLVWVLGTIYGYRGGNLYAATRVSNK